MMDETDKDLIQEAVTMLSCIYYAYEIRCNNGCYEEPRCVTNEPRGGWAWVLVKAEMDNPGSVLLALS